MEQRILLCTAIRSCDADVVQETKVNRVGADTDGHEGGNKGQNKKTGSLHLLSLSLSGVKKACAFRL